MKKLRSKFLLNFLSLIGSVLLTPIVLAQTVTPTVSSIDPQTKALLQKANGVYYNYSRDGLHKFQCQVKVSVLENLKNTMRTQNQTASLKALENLKFTLTFDEKKGFQFSYLGFEPKGDAKFDGSVMKLIESSQKTILGYCDIWKSLAFEPAFDLEKCTYKVDKTPTGYQIDQMHEGLTTAHDVTADLVITEARVFKDKDTIAIKIDPQFLKLPKGLLMNSVGMEFSNGLMKEQIDTEYKETNHVQMPSKVKVDLQMNMSDQAPSDIRLNFDFLDYHIN